LTVDDDDDENPKTNTLLFHMLQHTYTHKSDS